MGIKRIYCDMMDYEVGKDNVTSIVLTEHGSEKTTIYEVTFDDGEVLFVGMLEHQVERDYIEIQMDIFDYLLD